MIVRGNNLTLYSVQFNEIYFESNESQENVTKRFVEREENFKGA